MVESTGHTKEGKLAISCGLLGLVFLLIYHLLVSQVIIVVIFLILGILAIGFGYLARKNADFSYGTLGATLGILTIVLQIAINFYLYYFVWV